VKVTTTESIGLAWSAAVRVAIEEIKRVDMVDWPEDEKNRQKKIIMEHHAAQWLWTGWDQAEHLLQMNGHSQADFSKEPKLLPEKRL
jgi:hypothetical protein